MLPVFILEFSRNHAALAKKYPTEQVFVVPYEKTKCIPDNFTLAGKLKLDLADWEQKGRFILRQDAEYNPAVQQLIPYILVANAKGTKLYVLERIGGEERLKGSLALGCGGHINPEDAGGIILNSALREMNEELKIRTKRNEQLRFIGYVRDLVGKTNDHTGFVFLIHATSASVREKESLIGRWAALPDLIADYERFESWARHIIDHLYVSHAGGRLFG